MKGQYRIVTEMFLFLIGILIAVFTLTTFGDVQSGTELLSLEDQLGGVANAAVNGIVKAAESVSIVRLEVPEQLSGKQYVMRLSDEGDALTVATVDAPFVSVTRQLFNISKSHDLTGEVLSASRFVEIVNDGLNIRLRRGSL